jgi:hypothetical protein
VVAASRREVAWALVAAAAVLLGAALLFGGGSGDGRLAWIGGAALLAAGVLCGAALWGWLPVPAIGREGVAFGLLSAGFLTWTGVTILWSILPDRSWDYFNRGLAYLMFAVIGAFVGSVVAPRLVAWTVGGLVAVTCFWALAGKAVPALYDDYGRLARLRSPVGYWNALALVAVFGIPVALWAATRHRREIRAGAVVGLYVFLLALLLTYSRGGVLAALVALALWFALTRDRFQGVVAFLEAGVPAALVFGVALLLPGITTDTQPHAVRAQDGAWFALAVVLGAGAAYALAYLIRYRPAPERERLLLRLALGAALVCVAAGAIAVSAHGNPFGTETAVGQGPGRLAEGSLNNRWSWWKEAWHGWVDEPLGGHGAGAFELVHRRFRDSNIDVREPHNLPLQFAAETGLVGLLLWGGAMAAALLGAWRALARLAGDDREAALALGIAFPAFLVHGLLDYDWDFVAVCSVVFFVAGFLLATGRAPIRLGREYAWVAVIALVTWAGLYSIAAPRLADARVNRAYSQIESGSNQAAETAKSAHSLNPLSAEPLWAWASAEEAAGRLQPARRLYVRAIELQPLNWETWYQLGLFDRDVLNAVPAYRREFRRAHELDPHGCPPLRALGRPCG